MAQYGDTASGIGGVWAAGPGFHEHPRSRPAKLLELAISLLLSTIHHLVCSCVRRERGGLEPVDQSIARNPTPPAQLTPTIRVSSASLVVHLHVDEVQGQPKILPPSEELVQIP